MKNSDSLQYPNVLLREIKEWLIYCFPSEYIHRMSGIPPTVEKFRMLIATDQDSLWVKEDSKC